jgi:hypothetical protein
MINRLAMFVIATLLTACGNGLEDLVQTPSPETAAELPKAQEVTSANTAVHAPTEPATEVPTQPATDALTPTATDEATQTATHVPTQTVTPFVSPISFSNIVSLRQEVPRVVWESAKNEVRSNYENSRSLVEIEVLVGPNTTLYFKDNEGAYRDRNSFLGTIPPAT